MTLSFSSLSLDRADEYRRLYELCPRKSSYYSFGSLWAWRSIRDFQWAFTDGLCWIRTSDGELWAPVGPWDRVSWKDLLPRLFPEGASFMYVPDELAGLWSDTVPEIECLEDRSQWEYLYSVQDLIALKGNRFSQKRSHIQQFMRKHSYRYHSLTEGDGDIVLWCQRLWFAERIPTEGTLRENEAVQEMVRQWHHIPGLLGGALLVDGVPVAYTVGEILSEDTVMVHFEKALSSYNGAYQTINRMFLEEECASFSVVNREEDLGDPGMRAAKMSYNPVGFLKKYSATWTPYPSEGLGSGNAPPSMETGCRRTLM